MALSDSQMDHFKAHFTNRQSTNAQCVEAKSFEFGMEDLGMFREVQ
jgi:hypothetical protein